MSTGWLHELHSAAFPLGIVIASHAFQKKKYIREWSDFREKHKNTWNSIFFYGIVFSAIIFVLFLDGNTTAARL